MDSIVLAEYLLKDIRQRKKDFAESLVNGSIDTIENYRMQAVVYLEDYLGIKL